ncbi:MAG: sugar phosphate nucleotidyltransferase [Oscillospiraceae bacterium]|nr:sugar phosphate nucleotidyltransferase [Oscillospiraceae bacterium]
MKAIIMAGGEGTRLRPVSVDAPKPMVRLFDRPVLGHILHLLKKNQIAEACLTLRFMPRAITDHFGDGADYGLQLTHQIEETPLGTAGSVAACSEFIDGEDVLIISGDAVCDFDLQQCIQFHRERNADATIVLYAHPEPLEYGLVMTDETGRIERFIEKPPWNQVFTNRVNTGIYILSPKAIAEIPGDGPYDFGRDLFPKLLEKGMKLYGVEAPGYWCDIGSPAAYLQSGIDALEEKLHLDFGVERRGHGLWTHSPIPVGVVVRQPCYIGQDVILETGAVIGPHAMIGAGSHISTGAEVVRSVVDGALVDRDVRLEGVVVGRGASLRRGCILQEGAVIGGGTIVGEDVIVAPGVRVWPQKEIPAGAHVTENLISGLPRSGLRFSDGGAIRGEIGINLTPEACFAIGSALGRGGRVGIGCAGDAASRLAARSIACGVSAAGGSGLELDGGFEAALRFGADLYDLKRTVFASRGPNNESQITLQVYGPRGMPLTREQERQVESALFAGEFRRADVARIGELIAITGTLEAYISAAASWGDLGEAPVFSMEVRGNGSANRALRRALEQMGAKLTSHSRDIPVFQAIRDGMALWAEDEAGHVIEPEQILAILVALELESGAKTVAVPYAAPMALDQLAASFDAQILRLGRDRGAEGLYYRRPYLRDGIFAATRLVGIMAANGKRLCDLRQNAPPIHMARREVSVTKDRAALMRELAGTLAESATELVEGIRLPVGRGWVHISPAAARPVLQIHGESGDMEAAEEICIDFARRLEALDR